MMMQVVFDAINEGLQSPGPEARRFFHGRGHCYEGLAFINVDWFPPVLLITLYEQPDNQPWQVFLEQLKSLQPQLECAIVQHRYQPGAPITPLWGGLPDKHNAVENDLLFALQFGGKQNFGFFLDMAPGRAWLKEHAQAKKVLNLFAYTCAFSVAAIAGGAHSVVNVDMSGAALNVGRLNHRLNGHQQRLKRDVDFMPYNLFRSWGKVLRKGPYDIVVIDPPSRQKGSFMADKDYARVVRRLPELLTEQGQVLACLNAPELSESFLLDLFAEYCPQLVFVTRLENRSDMPEKYPQRSLKMLRFQRR
jgi:23S rRNA (cytosine1962-C5)-methyltransferase